MRILIADDNERIRRGLTEILSAEKNWVVCGEASDGAEAVGMSRKLLPDLVLLDMNMPGASGFETTRLLRREMPGIRILIITYHDCVRLLPAALEAGADGCVEKGRIAADLIAAIAALHRPPAPS